MTDDSERWTVDGGQMTEEEVEIFEKVEAQLEGLHEEVGVLSKKRPDDKVNNWKLKFANIEPRRAGTSLRSAG